MKLAIGPIVAVAAIGLGDYLLDAHKRISRGHLCEWEKVPHPDNVRYEGRWCKLTKDTALLQLYDSRKTLVAERMFFELDKPIFFGDGQRLGYDSRGEGAAISLPPTWLDRLRARLP